MPTFTIISAQEMERLIPLGQRMTGLTAKKMNKMDILELMGFLPKEILLQILLGEDWWKPFSYYKIRQLSKYGVEELGRQLHDEPVWVPKTKVGGFRWDTEFQHKNGVTLIRKKTDRNLKAALQITLPFINEIDTEYKVVKMSEKRVTLQKKNWNEQQRIIVRYSKAISLLMDCSCLSYTNGYGWSIEEFLSLGFADKARESPAWAKFHKDRDYPKAWGW